MKTLLTITKIRVLLSQWQNIFQSSNEVDTIGDFIERVDGMAKEKYPNAETNKIELDALNTFKGDMLEVLSEIFFRIYASDVSVGVNDYTPIALSEDYGVDAIGKNVNGDKCAIQVKYRSNPLDLITWPDMAKTYGAGRELHGLSLDKNDTIFLFTTGNGITVPCQNVLKNKIRVINRKIIAGHIDHNKNFWEQAEDLIVYSLENAS